MHRAVLFATVLAISFSSSGVFAAPFPGRTAIVKPMPAAKTGAYGWQPVTKFSLPATTTSLSLLPVCPDSHPRAVSGEYRSSVDQVMVVSRSGSGNLDTPSNSAKWGFVFYFPNGSLANTVITFSIYCADKNEPPQFASTQPR